MMGTNEMDKRKNKTIRFIIISILIIAVISLIGFAFARYITRINGNAQVPIANWNFNVSAGSKENLNIDLAETREANENSEVDSTKVAPGTRGALVLNINASRKSSFAGL